MSQSYNFSDTLPNHIVDSLSEPKIHSVFSDILRNLLEFDVNIAFLVALVTILIVIYFFTYVKDVKRKNSKKK